MSMSKDEIMDAVNEAIAPGNMSQREAKEFLEDLIADLQISADALDGDDNG